MKNKNLLLSCVFLTTGFLSTAQSITVTNTQTPAELVNDVLVGSGVVISNIEFNYSVPLANSVQVQAGYFNAGTSTFPISEGLILATGNVTVALGPNNSGSMSNNTGVAPSPNDADLVSLNPGLGSFNQAVLEFDFVPSGDHVAFNYIFASEEYPEFVFAGVNDAFGFFISGPGISGPYMGGGENIALVPGTTTPVTIDDVNATTNSAFYVDNGAGTAVQYDGHTVVMVAESDVICGETYHIKLAIGDVGDPVWDSAVFLEASSFSSNGVQVEIGSATGASAVTEACDSAIVTFIRPEDQVSTALSVPYGVTGTAINGTDYPFLPGSITFPIGVDTVQFYVVPIGDGLTEGAETVIFTVEIINECGDTITTTATIEITDPIPFNVVPVNVTIDCPVPTVNITANPSGGIPTFEYEWETLATTPTISVPGNIAGTTSYDVDITDACGTTATGTVTVTLNPAPVPTINFNFNTITICPDEDATIIGTVINPYSPAIDYDWSPAPGGTTNTITVSPNVLTWYYLTINDGCYTVTDSVKVEMGTIDLTAINVVDATNCPGQPGTPGSIEVLPDPADHVYTLIGGGDVFGPQTSNMFINLDGGIIYFLHVENGEGCTIDTAVEVGLGANAVVATWLPASEEDVTCFGSLDGAAAISNVGGGILPPYDVTWTHVTGLYDQTTINVGGGDAINNLMGGNWVVTVTDQEGCAWSHLFNIFEPAELTLDFISNDPSCYLFTDGSVTAATSGGNGGNTFTMTNAAGTQLNLGNSNTINQLGTGWYYTTIVDSKGCNVEDSIFIDQPGELDVDLIVNQPLCYGFATGYVEADTVYNYTGSYANVGYFWNPNPSGVNGIGSIYTSHLGPGSYTLTLNDENGCSKTFDFSIAYPPELVFTEIGFHPAHCRMFNYQSGNGVVYAAAGGGTPDYDYLWVNNTTGQTTTNTTWGGLNPASYTVTVTDDAGCLLTQTIQLDSVSPIADFEPSSEQFLVPGVYEGTALVCVDFTNQSQYFSNPQDPNTDTTFFWNFNSPNSVWQISHDFNAVPDTCYSSEGVYTVCLVALNKNGCSDTACIDLIIHDSLIFEPVNIFTPDGDGINDGFTFDFRAQAVETFECTIINRWGTTMFVMDDITDVWDGTDMNGDPCTDGLYFYTYSLISTDRTTESGQGNITIVNSKH